MTEQNNTTLDGMNKDVRGAILEAFQETGCMDLYDGDAVAYLKVITQTLRCQRVWREHAEGGIRLLIERVGLKIGERS